MLKDPPLAETLQERGMARAESNPRAPTLTLVDCDVRMTRPPLAEETLHTTMSFLEVMITSPLLPGFAGVFSKLAKEGMHEGRGGARGKG